MTAHIEPYARNYSTYINHGCRCPDCTADQMRQIRDYRHNRMPDEVRKRYSQARTRRFQRRNDQAATNAVAHYRPWTPEELAVARDRRLSVRQAAALLGRTLNSIKHMRRGTR